MRRQARFLFLAALGLMGLAAFFLARIQAFQKMGQPGVSVVNQPMYDPDGKMIGSNSVALPERVLNYESEQMPIDHIVLSWLPPDTTYGHRLYRAPAPDGFEVLLNVVLMGSDRTSIHKPQYCLTGLGWTITRTERTSIAMTEPYPYDLPVMKLRLQREVPTAGGGKVQRSGVFVYWFVADNQLSADHLERMWWMARDMVGSGVWQRWAYVTCFAFCLPGQEEPTYARLREFITASVPRFQLAAGPPRALAQLP